MDQASLVRQLLSEKPHLAAPLRTLTDDPACRAAVNDVLAVMLEMQATIHHKRTRAAACVRPREGLYGAQGFKALNHVPDVLLRALCEISEQPYVTNATTEWLDEMEARHVPTV